MIKDNGKYEILIIEDNPGDLFIVEEFLCERMSNMKITHFDNFKSAEAEIEKGSRFDVILLDLTLPDLSGQKLITSVLGIANECPVVVLTGYQDVDFSKLSISQGVSDYLLKDELNSAILFKSIIYSIERKKTISLLHESEKRYSNLFHLSPQPMMVFDLSTLKFIQVNRATIALYGFSEEEFLQMTIAQIRPESQIEFMLSVIENTKRIDQTFSYTDGAIHRKKSGELINVEIFGTPLKVENELYRLIIVYDVTEKKLFELKLTEAIIKTQEDERYEIGGELHDNVCQILATSQMSMGMIKKVLDPDALKWYEQSKEYIKLASEEIRNLSHRLAPIFLDQGTLQDSIHVLINTFNGDEKYVINEKYDTSVNNYSLSRETQLNLYRIIQEQLRNIQKHSNATTINLSISKKEGSLLLTIKDNGLGCDPENTRAGIGIANMKRRVELFAGDFKLSSIQGVGCELEISIPVKHLDNFFLDKS